MRFEISYCNRVPSEKLHVGMLLSTYVMVLCYVILLMCKYHLFFSLLLSLLK